MAIYKLYIDVLFAASTELEADIEIEAFGHQQFELVGNQLNMSDVITVQAETASEALHKASAMITDQYTANHHIGYYRIVDGSHGYLNAQAMASHIHFAVEEMDDEYEEVLEEINVAYYVLMGA